MRVEEVANLELGAALENQLRARLLSFFILVIGPKVKAQPQKSMNLYIAGVFFFGGGGWCVFSSIFHFHSQIWERFPKLKKNKG